MKWRLAEETEMLRFEPAPVPLMECPVTWTCPSATHAVSYDMNLPQCHSWSVLWHEPAPLPLMQCPMTWTCPSATHGVSYDMNLPQCHSWSVLWHEPAPVPLTDCPMIVAGDTGPNNCNCALSRDRAVMTVTMVAASLFPKRGDAF
jgi:hypothetical protein